MEYFGLNVHLLIRHKDEIFRVLGTILIYFKEHNITLSKFSLVA